MRRHYTPLQCFACNEQSRQQPPLTPCSASSHSSPVLEAGDVSGHRRWQRARLVGVQADGAVQRLQLHEDERALCERRAPLIALCATARGLELARQRLQARAQLLHPGLHHTLLL